MNRVEGHQMVRTAFNESARTPVRAGAATALLVGPDVRRLAVGDLELVQRIYVAVRDTSWNTIGARYSGFRYDFEKDEFFVSFRAHHQWDAIDFEWTGEIRGYSDGALTYAMDGVCNSQFECNKIGLNIHHPLESCIGVEYCAEADTTVSRGRLPRYIAPQALEGGRLTAMFPPYRKLRLFLQHDMVLTFTFDGDLFEMQDQRNWSDANFKTYGTPMRVPYPFTVPQGTAIRQCIRVESTSPKRTSVPVTRESPTIRLTRNLTKRCPGIGFGVEEQRAPLDELTLAHVRDLSPSHLRIELHLGDFGRWRELLDDGVRVSRELSTALEIAAFIPSMESVTAVRALADELSKTRHQVRRIFVLLEPSQEYADSTFCTPCELVSRVRNAINAMGTSEVEVVGGTDGNFAEVNRDPQVTSDYGGVVYPITPQIHSNDDMSLVENIRAQCDTVLTAIKRVEGNGVFVSPISLVSRRGPYTLPSRTAGLAPDVDSRLWCLLGAAWTVGSLSEMCNSGVKACTYFELTGPKGLVPEAGHSPESWGDSGYDGARPAYYVFKWLAPFKHGRVVAVDITGSDRVAALAICADFGLIIEVANLTPYPEDVDLENIPNGEACLTAMNERDLGDAKRDVNAFECSEVRTVVRTNALRVRLSAFGVASIAIRGVNNLFFNS